MKSRKTLASIIAVVLIGTVVALGFAAWTVKTSLAAFVAQTSPTPQAPGQQGTTVTNTYAEQFLQALANQLGTTVDKLKSAITSAANTVIDQAVKDGKITQSQADQLKQKTANGNFPDDFLFERGGRGFGFGHGGFGMRGVQVGVAEFASALGMNQADLMTELQAGKSIADVAAEKNIDIKQVTQKVLADAKTKLDQAVQNKQLTQAQADMVYQKLSANIDQLVQQKGLLGHKGFWPGWKKRGTPQNSPSATPGAGL